MPQGKKTFMPATIVILTAVCLLTAPLVANATKKGRESTGKEGAAAVSRSRDAQEKQRASVVYEGVEMRRYEGKGGHPYIHETRTNNTAKTIVGYAQGMLAFDKQGNPLKIDWWSLDTKLDAQYDYLYTSGEVRIPPGKGEDVRGGFSLNIMGSDRAVEKIAYVLYCDKEIEFEDGSVWKNPDFANWLATYKGKKWIRPY